jgi:hypothetical protein
MTGQDLLNTMELLNAELQLQSGEEDVTRGLTALNRAQDYFETIAASVPGFKGDTTGEVLSVDSTETTAFPTGVLRIDAIWRLGTNSLPEQRLDPIHETGGHLPTLSWPVSLGYASASPGKPTGYYTNARSIYWSPLPNDAYTFRWYGFQAASDITAGGTFAYDDVVALPLASFACRLMKIGLDDDQDDIGTLAENTFRPVIKALSHTNRDGGKPLQYRYSHGT